MAWESSLRSRSVADRARTLFGRAACFLEINGKGAASWVLESRIRENARKSGWLTQSGFSSRMPESRFLTRQKIAQGIDPVAERKQERQVIPTFRKLPRWSTRNTRSLEERQASGTVDIDAEDLRLSQDGRPLGQRNRRAPVRDDIGTHLADKAGNGASRTATHRHRLDGPTHGGSARPKRQCGRFPRGCLVSPRRKATSRPCLMHPCRNSSRS